MRLTYNSALAAHQSCMRALTEAAMAGTRPAAALVDNEIRAREQLERARERLLAAMTEAITGQRADPEAGGAPLPSRDAATPEPSTPS